MERKKAIVLLVIGIVIGAIGCYYCLSHHYAKNLQKLQADYFDLENRIKQNNEQPPKVVTDATTETKIKYVPKETIVYKDPVTGKTVTEKETTDIDLGVKPPSISMKYNGKNYQMAGISGETSKFADGKLVGEVSTSATIDVTDIVNHELARSLKEREKDVSIGGYLTNQGFVGSLGIIQDEGNREIKLIAKVPKVKEFYGLGVEVKF